MRVLFFGTPQIAVPYLDWLSQHTTVVGVVCRKDEPVGRGYQITPPPTKVFAQSKNIPVFQPDGPWTEALIKPLKDTHADVGIAVAYGRLMPRPVFMAPRLGCLNIHFSLLPKYRGAAPMQWALINGETKTGVSAFWIEEGLDSGPVFHQSEVAIAPTDYAPELREKLVPLGVDVLSRVIKDIEADKLIKNPQKGEPTLAPLLKKEMGQIDWEKPAAAIGNLVRGVCEWPGAVTRYQSEGALPKQLKIHRVTLLSAPGAKEPGTIVNVIKDQGFVVQAGEGHVLVTSVQPEGKKAMPAGAFWQGARLNIGDKLG